MTEAAWTIFATLGEWFDNNPSTNSVNWSAFSAWYTLVRHAKMPKERLEAHKELLAVLAEREVPHELSVKPLLEGLARREYATRVADIALKISDGDHASDFDAITRLLEEYNKETGRFDATDKKLGSFSADTIRSTTGPGLDWSLGQSLGQALGPIRLGDLIVFGKRPDAGGTTFLADAATFMVDQLQPDEVILWVNNEEAGDKVRTRIMQARLGWTSEEMDVDEDATFQAYADTMPNPQMIMVYDDAKAHVNDVERLLKTLKVRLVIFDQLRKMKGLDTKASEDHDKLEALFNWAREIAKEYAPVIVVHQLGTEADNKKWIGYEAMFGSKTGLQGEADVIVTMGRIYADGDLRYLFVPKNKLKTPGDPTKRNGKFIVRIHPDIARYSDVQYVP